VIDGVISRRVRQHLEGVLGTPFRASTAHDVTRGIVAAFGVATFRDQPVEGAFTLVTVGLSEHLLPGDESEPVRQELLVCAWDRFFGDALYQAFFSMADLVLEDGTRIDPGTVYELPERIADAMGSHRFFAYPPCYHPEELQPIQLDDGEVEIRWLIPIAPEESDFVEREGAEAFDDLLELENPDLMDLDRGSVV